MRYVKDSGVALAAVVLAAPIFAAHGWLIALLWRWFVVPLGVRAITAPHALGLEALVMFLLSQTSSDSPELTWEMLRSALASTLSKTLAVVVVAGAAHLLMVIR